MSIEQINSKKKEMKEIEKKRRRLISLIFSPVQLIEGSLRDSLGKCGRKGCRCEKEPAHPVTRLSRWENGKLKNKLVRAADRQRVRKLSDNYKKHKEALNVLIKLNDKEKEILKNVIKLKTIKYE